MPGHLPSCQSWSQGHRLTERTDGISSSVPPSTHDPPSCWRGHGSSGTVYVHSVSLTVPMQAEYFQLSTQLE
ncbi:hypothetical protein T12_5870 [Trichinella patagoniensis]|uniref:Uncharacterized protein n=1 Tax=Trichinella patagoniensis TaxID=990121 RepID=A0A0V0YYQ2_9BILA|nr:hypothetical protein T12_5870 [Trichinella patagoniensis]